MIPAGAKINLLFAVFAIHAHADFSANLKAPQIYLNIVGQSVSGGANAGLLTTLSKTMNESPCLQASVRMMYTKKREWVFGKVPLNKYLLSNSLDSTKDETGSIYQEALAFFGGDADLATFAVGVCGHDNLSNGLILDRSNDPVLASFQDPNPVDKNSLMICPKGESPLFKPGSIGVDISDELRSKIIQIQSPSDGGGALSAKYYHTIGGSLVGCLLKQKGVSESVAAGIHATGVRDYRALRLAGQITSALQNYGPTLMEPEKYQFADGFAQHNVNVKDAKAKRLIHEAAILVQQQAALKEIDLSKDLAQDKQVSIAVRMHQALTQALEKKCTSGDEACEAVYAKLQTWMVDFEWSEQAGIAGLHAAYQRCSDLSQGNKSLEQKACAFLKSNPEMPQPGSGAGAIK